MDISVAIVEDDPQFLSSFRQLLAGTPDLKLIATADDLPGGMQMLLGEAADVLLVDLDLPGGSGSAADIRSWQTLAGLRRDGHHRVW